MTAAVWSIIKSQAARHTMTNNTQIKVHVDVAKLNIVLEAWVNGAPTGNVTLSPADTDSLIRELGKNRAQLVQPVAADPDEAAIDPVIDPAWQTPEVRYQEGRMLSVRDPGLGWLTYIFPDQEAADVAAWLTKDLPLQQS
jgi:hypothetical protein